VEWHVSRNKISSCAFTAVRVRGPRQLNSRFRYEEAQFVPQRHN
jgi:hypothetical protein